MSELEKIENVEEAETIPTDNTTNGEVSGEVTENEQAQKYNVH